MSFAGVLDAVDRLVWGSPLMLLLGGTASFSAALAPSRSVLKDLVGLTCTVQIEVDDEVLEKLDKVGPVQSRLRSEFIKGEKRTVAVGAGATVERTVDLDAE